MSASAVPLTVVRADARAQYLKEQTACAVCTDLYDDKANKPIGLKCGHTFCEACVQKVRDCPTCRTNIGDKRLLKPNYPVLAQCAQRDADIAKAQRGMVAGAARGGSEPALVPPGPVLPPVVPPRAPRELQEVAPFYFFSRFVLLEVGAICTQLLPAPMMPREQATQLSHRIAGGEVAIAPYMPAVWVNGETVNIRFPQSCPEYTAYTQKLFQEIAHHYGQGCLAFDPASATITIKGSLSCVYFLTKICGIKDWCKLRQIFSHELLLQGIQKGWLRSTDAPVSFAPVVRDGHYVRRPWIQQEFGQVLSKMVVGFDCPAISLDPEGRMIIPCPDEAVRKQFLYSLRHQAEINNPKIYGPFDANVIVSAEGMIILSPQLYIPLFGREGGCTEGEFQALFKEYHPRKLTDAALDTCTRSLAYAVTNEIVRKGPMPTALPLVAPPVPVVDLPAAPVHAHEPAPTPARSPVRHVAEAPLPRRPEPRPDRKDHDGRAYEPRAAAPARRDFVPVRVKPASRPPAASGCVIVVQKASEAALEAELGRLERKKVVEKQVACTEAALREALEIALADNAKVLVLKANRGILDEDQWARDAQRRIESILTRDKDLALLANQDSLKIIISKED